MNEFVFFLFVLRYMNFFIKVIFLFDIVIISFFLELFVVVEYKVVEMGYICYYLVFKIEEEEDINV